MSDWSTTPPSAQEYPRAEQGGFARLLERLQNVERQLADMRSNTLRTAGVSVAPEGMTIGSALRVTGDALFEGNLNVPNGSIKNDWLEAPIVAASNYGNEGPFEITTTPTARATWTVTVPAGYTKGFLISDVSLQALNGTGSTQYVYVRAYVQYPDASLSWSSRSMATLGAGFAGTVSADVTRALGGPLAGGDTLTFYAHVSASATIPSDVANSATGECLVLFTR